MEGTYSKLDFLGIIDLLMTAEAEVCRRGPACSHDFEIESYQLYPGYARLREPVIQPVGQAREQPPRSSLTWLEGWDNGDLYPQSEEAILETAFAAKPEVLADLLRILRGIAPAQEINYRKYELGLLRRDGRPGFDNVREESRSPRGPSRDTEMRDPRRMLSLSKGRQQIPGSTAAYPLILNTGEGSEHLQVSASNILPSLVRLQEKALVLTVSHRRKESRDRKGR